MAAATEWILLGTAVLLLPYYHPVLLAKQLATIDVLSGGRMRLDGQREEMSALAGRLGLG